MRDAPGWELHPEMASRPCDYWVEKNLPGAKINVDASTYTAMLAKITAPAGEASGSEALNSTTTMTQNG